MTFGVTVWCFVVSYIIVVVLEYSRPVFAFKVRPYLILGWMALGWLTHTMYLADQMWLDMAAKGLLASWFQWALLVAWGISTLYIVLLIRRMDNALGTFILPLLMGSIFLAFLWRDTPPFPRTDAISLWGRIHGISIAVGAMVIIFGLGTGLMYLVQSYRLKHKFKSVRSFRLPSLEYLQWLNRTSIFVSCAMLTTGLLSGIVLNLNKYQHITWFSAGIIVPFALCLWSAVAVAVEVAGYRSFGGKRTAYLTVANFVFLALVLGLFFLTPHQRSTTTQSQRLTTGLVPVEAMIDSYHIACTNPSACGERNLHQDETIHSRRVTNIIHRRPSIRSWLERLGDGCAHWTVECSPPQPHGSTREAGFVVAVNRCFYGGKPRREPRRCATREPGLAPCGSGDVACTG